MTDTTIYRCPACGTLNVTHCGRSRHYLCRLVGCTASFETPPAVTVADEIITGLAEFTVALEAGDLSGFRVTKRVVPAGDGR